LNEGFTVYLERKCAKAVHGGGKKGDLELQLQAAIGDDDLLKTVASHKPAYVVYHTHHPSTSYHITYIHTLQGKEEKNKDMAYP
jgi:hypothetical protein